MLDHKNLLYLLTMANKLEEKVVTVSFLAFVLSLGILIFMGIGDWVDKRNNLVVEDHTTLFGVLFFTSVFGFIIWRALIKK